MTLVTNGVLSESVHFNPHINYTKPTMVPLPTPCTLTHPLYINPHIDYTKPTLVPQLTPCTLTHISTTLNLHYSSSGRFTCRSGRLDAEGVQRKPSDRY